METKQSERHMFR